MCQNIKVNRKKITEDPTLERSTNAVVCRHRRSGQDIKGKAVAAQRWPILPAGAQRPPQLSLSPPAVVTGRLVFRL